MPRKPDPLQLSHGHLAIAGAAALELNKCLRLAHSVANVAEARWQVSLAIMTHQNTMRQLALSLAELPPFFQGNLPTSLNLAADWKP